MQHGDPTGSVGSTVRQNHLLITTMHSEGLAGQTETFVRFGVTQRLEMGFGYLWRQNVVRPLGTYTFLTETEQRPALTGGILMDSLGGGRQGAFVSVSKDLEAITGFPASVYVGTARISNENRFRPLAGTNIRLGGDINATAQFDGRYMNLGVTAGVGRVAGAPLRIGVVAARGSQIGPIIATSIPIGRAPQEPAEE